MGKKKAEYIFPIVHFMLSFIYERIIFDFSMDYSCVLAIAKGGVSDRFEMVLTYTISKVISAIFIWYFWKLFFYLKDGGIKQTAVRNFVIFWAAGLLILSVLWPNVFFRSEDNLITYEYAINFAPEYWHSMYSGCIYAAAMMVLPFNFSINVVQWTAFAAALGYLYTGLGKCDCVDKKRKWMIFLIFAIPDTYLIFNDSYRTEQYAILCLFYISIVLLDILGKKKRSPKELVLLAVLSAFIGVWRSEGLVLGIFGFMALVFFVYKLPVKKALAWLLMVIACFAIISVPQKLGDYKYYGKDYSFINSLPTLHNILCCEDANLSYEGVSDDLAAIEAVVPVEMVAYRGMEGYRRYNYACGRGDINQSLATEETSAAYMSAFYRMVLHNPVIYAKNQISFLLQALKLRNYPYIETYRYEVTKDYGPWEYKTWATGRALYTASCGEWMNNPLRVKLSNAIIGAYRTVTGWLERVGIVSAMYICAVLTEILIFLKEFIRFIKKKTDTLGFAVFALVLLMQAAAIVCVMPAGITAYFHGYLYCTLILDLVYIMSAHGLHKSKTEVNG